MLKNKNSSANINFYQNEDGLMDFFEQVVQKTNTEPKKLIGWVIKELMGNLHQQNLKVTQRSARSYSVVCSVVYCITSLFLPFMVPMATTNNGNRDSS